MLDFLFLGMSLQWFFYDPWRIELSKDYTTIHWCFYAQTRWLLVWEEGEQDKVCVFVVVVF